MSSFVLLESKKEIAKAQRTLEATIRREFYRSARKTIGYPSGRMSKVNVNTNGIYWYRSAHHEHHRNPRRLNLFGLFREDADIQISVEINVPYEGRNDQIGGYFARENETGSIYLMHSGRVAGGTRGVGKSTFLARSNEPLVSAVDASGGVRLGVVVMAVTGKGATRPPSDMSTPSLDSNRRSVWGRRRRRSFAKSRESLTTSFPSRADGVGAIDLPKSTTYHGTETL